MIVGDGTEKNLTGLPAEEKKRKREKIDCFEFQKQQKGNKNTARNKILRTEIPNCTAGPWELDTAPSCF